MQQQITFKELKKILSDYFESKIIPNEQAEKTLISAVKGMSVDPETFDRAIDEAREQALDRIKFYFAGFSFANEILITYKTLGDPEEQAEKLRANIKKTIEESLTSTTSGLEEAIEKAKDFISLEE